MGERLNSSGEVINILVSGTKLFGGVICRQLASIISSNVMLTRLPFEELLDCHCEFCGEPELLKLLWLWCSRFIGIMMSGPCSDTLLGTGAMVGMEMLEFRRVALIASFSCLKSTDSVSAWAIISRRLITSCSRCLT